MRNKGKRVPGGGNSKCRGPDLSREGHAGLTHPRTAGLLLAIGYQCQVYQSHVDAVECKNWETLTDYAGPDAREVATEVAELEPSITLVWGEGWASVTLSSVRHGFKGMWLKRPMVSGVGCIPGHLCILHVPG